MPASDTVSAYPTDVTFHELIARNKRNTVLLVLGMGLLTVIVFTAIAAGVMAYTGQAIVMDTLLMAAGVAVVLTGLGATYSYFGGAKTILNISGAKPLDKADDPQLFNVVEELAIAGGLPMPRIYLIDSPALNAFATGRDPKHAVVAITNGLREKLTRDELQGVMAHEIAHIRHYDIRLTMMMATMVGLIVLACHVFLRGAFYSTVPGRRSVQRRSRGGGGGGMAILLLVLGLLLAVVAPLLARFIQLAVSRQREYLADAGAVALTRYPQGLIGALRKLAADHTPLESANRATAHLFIDNPFLQASGEDDWDSMMSTHPPMSQRIARLQALLK